MGPVLLGDLWAVQSSDLSSAGSLGCGMAILGKMLSLYPVYDLEAGLGSSALVLDGTPSV